jgi:Sodium/hydrogen exchanger family
MGVAEFLRSHAMALPVLAKFACGMAIIVGIPQLCRRIRLPPAVGLLASGIAIGPHGLDMFGQHRPIADFFAELGKLLLMFTTGLEIDIALFRKAQARSVIFRSSHYGNSSSARNGGRSLVWLPTPPFPCDRFAAGITYTSRIADCGAI